MANRKKRSGDGSSPENGKKAVNRNKKANKNPDPQKHWPDSAEWDNQQSPDPNPTDGMSLLSLPNGPTAGPLQKIHNQKMQEKHRLQPDKGTHADPVPNMPEKPLPMDEWDEAEAKSREPSPVSFNPMVFGPAILKAVFGGGEKEPDPVEKPEVAPPTTVGQPEDVKQPDTVKRDFDPGTPADPKPSMPEPPLPVDAMDKADEASSETRGVWDILTDPETYTKFPGTVMKALSSPEEKETPTEEFYRKKRAEDEADTPAEKPGDTAQPDTDGQPEVTTQPDTVDQPAATGEPDPLPKPDVSDVNEYAQQFGGAGSLSAAGGGSQPSSIETPDRRREEQLKAQAEVEAYRKKAVEEEEARVEAANVLGKEGPVTPEQLANAPDVQRMGERVRELDEWNQRMEEENQEEGNQGGAAPDHTSGDLSSTAESRFDAAQGMQVSSAGQPLGGSGSDTARLVDILTDIKAATEATRDAIEAMRDEGVTITF